MVDLPPPEPKRLPKPEQPPEADQQPEAQEPQEAEEALEPEAAAAPDGGEAPAEPKKRMAFTALEIAAQVHQVQEWLTEGKRPNQIRRLCSEEWGLQTRVAEKRIHDARLQMVQDSNCMDRKEKVAQMLQQLEEVLEQALQSRQGSNAIGAIRLQADLLQLLTRQN